MVLGINGTDNFRSCDPQEFGNLVLQAVDKKLEGVENSAKAGAPKGSETRAKQEEWAAGLDNFRDSITKTFAENIEGIVDYAKETIPELPDQLRDPAMGLTMALIKRVHAWFTALSPTIMRLRRNLGKCVELFGKISKYAWAAIKLMFKFFLNPAGLKALGTCLK